MRSKRHILLVPLQFRGCRLCHAPATHSLSPTMIAQPARLLKSARLPNVMLCWRRPASASALRTSPRPSKTAKSNPSTSSSRVMSPVLSRHWKSHFSRLTSTTRSSCASSTEVWVRLLKAMSISPPSTTPSSWASTFDPTRRQGSARNVKASTFVSTPSFTTRSKRLRAHSRACSSPSSKRSNRVLPKFARSSSPRSSERLPDALSAREPSPEMRRLVSSATVW